MDKRKNSNEEIITEENAEELVKKLEVMGKAILEIEEELGLDEDYFNELKEVVETKRAEWKKEHLSKDK